MHPPPLLSSLPPKKNTEKGIWTSNPSPEFLLGTLACSLLNKKQYQHAILQWKESFRLSSYSWTRRYTTVKHLIVMSSCLITSIIISIFKKNIFYPAPFSFPCPAPLFPGLSPIVSVLEEIMKAHDRWVTCKLEQSNQRFLIPSFVLGMSVIPSTPMLGATS